LVAGGAIPAGGLIAFLVRKLRRREVQKSGAKHRGAKTDTQ
jgi:hypothetical protein